MVMLVGTRLNARNCPARSARELDALYSDVLISVTSSFRNPEMFDALQRKVLPEIFKQPGNDPARI
jgi:two-component system CheB/CheR fusion protein